MCELAAPSAAPQSVTAVSINSTEIRVTWLAPPPSTQNGQLSGYQVLATDETCSTVQSDMFRRVLVIFAHCKDAKLKLLNKYSKKLYDTNYTIKCQNDICEISYSEILKM